MKIGCGEWGFRELPMEQHFAMARKFGFRTLEFGIGGGAIGRLPVDLDEAGVRQFRELGRHFGIATPACCLENDFTLPDPSAHAAMLSGALEQIRLAHRCGATQVRLFAGFTPAVSMTDESWARMLDAFRQSDALCGALDITVAIETHGRITLRDGAAYHEHTVTTEPAAIRRLTTGLPPRVGFNWDPGNLKAVNPADRRCALPLLDGRITYCHLKDWRRLKGGWIACAMGDDDLDYAPLLRAVSFDGIYYIEYEPTADVEAGIQRSLDYLRRIGMELVFV